MATSKTDQLRANLLSSDPPHIKAFRIDKELKPLLNRYGIEYDNNASKADLVTLLEQNGVPLERVKPTTKKTPAKWKNLGIEQIKKDFPPGYLFNAKDGGAEDAHVNVNTGNGGTDAGGGRISNPATSNPAASDPATSNPATSDPAASKFATNNPVGSESVSISGPSNEGRTARPPLKLRNLPTTQLCETYATEAGLPVLGDYLLDENELRLLTSYPLSRECLPTIVTIFDKAMGKNNEKQVSKIIDLVNWVGSKAKLLRISVADAMVFLDSSGTSDSSLDLLEYFKNETYRSAWFDLTRDPNSKRQAAKRLALLLDIAMGPAVSKSQDLPLDTPTSSANAEFFMEVEDPYDLQKVQGRVIGKHMTKTKVLGVRLESLSKEYPKLGRGIWVECKQGSQLETYNKYVKGPNRKLESADVLLLGNCTSPESFDLDCVFTMKWGKTHHWYAYGRPKDDPTLPKMMFSRSTLSKGWKGTSATMRALERHLRRVGQPIPDAHTDTLEQITLRAPRMVAIKPGPDSDEEEDES